jgi:alpha-D-xyloside xylohydrolase
MKMRHIVGSLLMLASIIICSSCNVRCSNSSVTVKVSSPEDGGPRLVRLEVMGEKLIHVSATPENRFSDPQSLVIVPVGERPLFTVEENGDTVTVMTSALKANVLVSTGEVWFTDLSGNVILAEQVGGGKSFEPVEVDGSYGYSFRQVFRFLSKLKRVRLPDSVSWAPNASVKYVAELAKALCIGD